MKKRGGIVLILLGLILIPALRVGAKEVSNQSNTCVDVLLVFARGSGDNSRGEYLDKPFNPLFVDKEKASGAFFQSFQRLLDQDYPHITYKAQSVHNIPNKYNANGYTAPGIFGFPTILTDGVNADVSWWPVGSYQASIQGGQEEVVGYVRDEIGRCPNQQVVLGGFSQGAQVVGEALFDFTERERQRVTGLAMFGDPKYIGAKTSPKPWEDPVPYPWKRGDAGGRKRGISEARQPYVPDDMKNKTQSWCFKDDFICTGATTLIPKTGSCVGSMTISKDCFGAGHTRYMTYGIPDAASEIVQRMSPTLYALNNFRGGVDKSSGITQPVPHQPNTKPIDVMFLIDVSAGVDDVIGLLRAETDHVTGPMQGYFSDVRYGFAYYNEFDQYGTLLPRFVIGQQPQPYQPPFSPIYSTVLMSNLITKLAWGQGSGGGADVPDPHGLMIEKASLGTYWDPEAIKHLVLITDRPFKDSFTYNICNASIVTAFSLPNPECAADPPVETSALSYRHPELCEKVWLAIREETCALRLTTPRYVHNITRTFDDAIMVAQTQRTDVTIVIPHGLNDAVTDKPAAEKRMEYFAKATAGLFLKYNKFGRADYTDMLWRVLNHRPKLIALAYQDALEALGPNQVLGVSDNVRARANVPVTLDVSMSPITADKYRWDFDGDSQWDQETESPNIEHTFTSPSSGSLITVAAFDEEEEEARTTLPLTVEPYDGPLPDMSVPELPENISAKQLPDGDVAIAWQGGQPGTIMVIKDPDTGLPIVSLPVEQGSITIPNAYLSGDTLLILAAGENANSEPRTLAIEPLPIAIDNPDQLLSIKLFGLSPGETVAGNEILNPEAANVIQTASAPAVQAAVVNLSSDNTLPAPGPGNQVLAIESDRPPQSIRLTAASQPPVKRKSSIGLILIISVVSVAGILVAIRLRFWKVRV